MYDGHSFQQEQIRTLRWTAAETRSTQAKYRSTSYAGLPPTFASFRMYLNGFLTFSIKEAVSRRLQNPSSFSARSPDSDNVSWDESSVVSGTPSSTIGSVAPFVLPGGIFQHQEATLQPPGNGITKELSPIYFGPHQAGI